MLHVNIVICWETKFNVTTVECILKVVLVGVAGSRRGLSGRRWGPIESLLSIVPFSKKREAIPELAPLLWHSFGEYELQALSITFLI